MGIRRDFPLPANGIKCQDWVVSFNLKPFKGEVLRAKITRVGADLAKRVIQVRRRQASTPISTGPAMLSETIGRRLDHRGGADHPASARLVFDHHWLAQRFDQSGLRAALDAVHAGIAAALALTWRFPGHSRISVYQPQANKNARIVWAMFMRGKPFDARYVSVKPGQLAAMLPVVMAMATALA